MPEIGATIAAKSAKLNKIYATKNAIALISTLCIGGSAVKRLKKIIEPEKKYKTIQTRFVLLLNRMFQNYHAVRNN